MSIPYSCPHCAYQGKVADKLAGKVVKCKNCGGQFRVPSGDAATAQPLDAQPLDAQPVDAQPAEAWPAAEAVDAQPLDAEPLDAQPLDAAPVEAAPTDGGEVDEAGLPTRQGGMHFELPSDLDSEDASAAAAIDDDALDADDLEAGDDDGDVPDAAPADRAAAAAPAGPGGLPTIGASPTEGAAAEGGDVQVGMGGGLGSGGLVLQGGPSGVTPGAGAGQGAGKTPSRVAKPVGQAGPDERHCPKCGQVIKKATKLCRHCGFDLNFEHLLHGEKGAVVPTGPQIGGFGQRGAGQAAAGGEGDDKARARTSWPRVAGAIVLIAGFFLPWLTGIHNLNPNADRFRTPTDLSAFEILMHVSGISEIPKAPAPTPDPDAEPDDPASIPLPGDKVIGDRVPRILAGEPDTGAMVSLVMMLAVPLLALGVVLFEMARGGTSIMVSALPLLGTAGVIFTIGPPSFAMVSFGFFMAVGGAVLMLIPGGQD